MADVSEATLAESWAHRVLTRLGDEANMETATHEDHVASVLVLMDEYRALRPEIGSEEWRQRLKSAERVLDAEREKLRR